MEWYLLNEMPSNHVVTTLDVIISVIVGVAMITALTFICGIYWRKTGMVTN
jgi:hypothetical protein